MHRTSPDAVAALLAGVAPPDVALAVEPVEQRSDEHAAGRRAAARALGELPAVGDVSGAQGSRPTWPRGLVGSISHTRGWAGAVVARRTDHHALGLDLEVVGALPSEDAGVVCSAAEQSVLAGVAPGSRRDAVATLHWVGKEAAFKAWDAWCGGRLHGVDPRLLDVALGADGQVHAQPAPELADRLPGLPPLSGRWADAAGLVAVVLAAGTDREHPARDRAEVATTGCATVLPTGRPSRGGPDR